MSVWGGLACQAGPQDTTLVQKGASLHAEIGYPISVSPGLTNVSPPATGTWYDPHAPIETQSL